MYKAAYSRFLNARPGILHCAPHSHYYWPDVTRAAHLQYWDDAARFADDKWDYLFSEKIPAVQQAIADILHLPAAEQIVFAPNTHEFVYRILSCFAVDKPLAVLTTDAEFHSFRRQIQRLQERTHVSVQVVPTEPFANFAERWQEAVASQQWSLIFISQVFYNSGVVAPWVADWLPQVSSDETVIVIDGYHGFCALPTDLTAVADRVFYLAGAYKYGQGGEGACFLTVPRGCQLRPEYTGWFADFASLAKPPAAQTKYAEDGMRFAGSTMDFSALYRLEAVFQWWQRDGISIKTIQTYISELQQAFLQHLDTQQHPWLKRSNLLQNPAANQHGNFLTFRGPDAEQVAALARQLQEKGIHTDYRGDRLRFGFALYHAASDYQRILA